MQVGDTVVFCGVTPWYYPIVRGDQGKVVEIQNFSMLLVAFEVPAGRKLGSDLSGWHEVEATYTETLSLSPHVLAYPDEYTGICPSSAGMASQDVVVRAASLDEAKQMIWEQLFGSRYIARILDASGRTVWDEHDAGKRNR